MLATIYEMGPVPVAALAVGVALFNPKNLPLLLAAGQTIGASSAPVVIGIVFVLVANSPYLVAAGYSLLRRAGCGRPAGPDAGVADPPEPIDHGHSLHGPGLVLPDSRRSVESVADAQAGREGRRSRLAREASAGFVGAVGSLPDGMATAVLAGANPMAGLYASIAGPIVGGALTSTRVMVVATTSAAAVSAAGVIESPGGNTLQGIATLTALCGVAMILMTVLGPAAHDALRVGLGDDRVHAGGRAHSHPGAVA